METAFVLSSEDVGLVPFLESLGTKCRVLEGPGQMASPGEIAIFSVSTKPLMDGCLLMGRQVVFASHRLIHLRPAWARTTPFCHLVRSQTRSERYRQLALRQLVDVYQRFDPRQVDEIVPWGRVEQVCPREETVRGQLGAFRDWQNEVKALL